MLVLLFILVARAVSLTNFTTSVYSGQSATSLNTFVFADFGINWAVLNTISAGVAPSLSNVFLYRNSSLTSMPNLGNNISKIQAHPLNTPTYSNYLTMDFEGIFRVYSYDNFTLAYTNSAPISDVTFGSLNNTEVFIVSNRTNNVEKFNYSSNSVITTQSLSGKSPQQIVASNGRIIVYSTDQNVPSLGFISIFQQNFTLVGELNCSLANPTLITLIGIPTPNPIKKPQTLQLNSSLLTRSYSTTVQIWDITNLTLLKSITTTAPIFDALICRDVLAVYMQGFVEFYQVGGAWGLLGTDAVPGNLGVGAMRCFQVESIVGVHGASVGFNITYINFTYSLAVNTTINPAPNPAPNPSPDPSPDPSLIPPPIPPTNPSTNPPASTTPSSTTATTTQTAPQTQTVSQTFKTIISSPQFNSTSETMSQLAAVATASNIGGTFMRPFSSLLDQLTFYAYHSMVYPDVVELFSQQVDILNQLRLKPKFMDFQIPTPALDSINDLYLNESSFLPERSPSSLYFFDFLKEVVMSNFLMACASFIVFHLLFKLTFRMSRIWRIFNMLWGYFRHQTVWWNFLVMTISFNVRTFSFYCFAQLSIAACFNCVDKLNMAAMVLFLLMILLYAFSFYFLVFRFEKPELSKEVLELSDYALNSYVIEMNLNCVRGFFQAFAHGSFTSRHDIQVISLIIVDILTLSLVWRLKGQFGYKMTNVFVFTYLVGYLGFDVFIALYSFGSLESFNYELTFTIILSFLIGVTVLRMVFFTFAILYEIVQCLRKRNKIAVLKIREHHSSKPEKNQKIPVETFKNESNFNEPKKTALPIPHDVPKNTELHPQRIPSKVAIFRLRMYQKTK